MLLQWDSWTPKQLCLIVYHYITTGVVGVEHVWSMSLFFTLEFTFRMFTMFCGLNHLPNQPVKAEMSR